MHQTYKGFGMALAMLGAMPLFRKSSGSNTKRRPIEVDERIMDRAAAKRERKAAKLRALDAKADD